VFGSVWSWLVPLTGAALVFAFVLATTPPGFTSIGTVIFSSGADPAAYAAGAAASLALVTFAARRNDTVSDRVAKIVCLGRSLC
jgi:hypothetical protein